MKINIVTGFFLPVPPVAGGATEKIWHRLAQEFATAGHEVTFVSRAWPGFAEHEKAAGVTHRRLRGSNHTRRLAMNLWHDFWWGVRVARALPEADVTICNVVSLPAWLRRFRPAAGRVVAVVARMPKGQGRVYGAVDLIFSLSAAVTEKLRHENPALAARIVPFPFPIDWSLHATAGAARDATKPLTVGYVGRMHPEKGLDLLCGAMSHLATRTNLPPWRLEVVGPWSVPQGGGGESYCDIVVKRLRSVLGDRFEFAGPEFDAAKLARRYGAMDVFCYPSLADKGETFGVAIAEAMAAGCAPVVSDLDCFADLVHPGKNGLVFERNAPDAVTRLADAIGVLLTDKSLRARLSSQAKLDARRFDYSASARKVLEDLGRLLGGSAR